MKPGFGARCAACRSPLRPEIDSRMLTGESTRLVARWMTEQGESVSHNALGNHRREHLAVGEAIAERAVQAQLRFEEMMERGLSHVELLEKNAKVMRDLRDQGTRFVRDHLGMGKSPPNAVIGLLIGAAAEVRESTKAVQQALGETPEPDGRATENDVSVLTDEKLEALDAIWATAKQGTDSRGTAEA